MMPTNFLRAGLLRGMELEAKLGTSPFKFGFVGSTDVHNSLTAIEEDNFFGKMPILEPAAKRWEHKSKGSSWDAKLRPAQTRYTWHYLSAGYAVVWATENTRAAIWDALKRREAYGTSGSRIILRFFGGWGVEKGDAGGLGVDVHRGTMLNSLGAPPDDNGTRPAQEILLPGFRPSGSIRWLVPLQPSTRSEPSLTVS